MKIMYATTYIYDDRWKEFSRNKTGFGKMVNTIISSMKTTETVVLVSHVITKGHENWVLKRTLFDLLRAIRIKDIKQGIEWFFSWKQNFKSRARYFYYCIGKGYFADKIKKIKPDIVHIHGIGYETKIYIEVCEELSVPYIVTLHGLIGIDNSIAASPWQKEYEKEFLIYAAVNNKPVSVISTGIKRRIEKIYLNNRKANNISVVLNGTQIPYDYKSTVESKKNFDIDAFIAQYELLLEKSITMPIPEVMGYIDFQKENQKHILVYVGNITDNKNQIQAVRCMSNLPDDYILVIFGRECDGGNLRRYIVTHELLNRVIIAGFCDNPSEIWKRADLNLFLSKNDGFGLPVIEGYMYGVPAVMFDDLDAFHDIELQEGMIPIHDRLDFEVVDIIKEAINKEWDKTAIRHKALRFSLSHMKESYIDLYNNVLKNYSS